MYVICVCTPCAPIQQRSLIMMTSVHIVRHLMCCTRKLPSFHHHALPMGSDSQLYCLVSETMIMGVIYTCTPLGKKPPLKH